MCANGDRIPNTVTEYRLQMTSWESINGIITEAIIETSPKRQQ